MALQLIAGLPWLAGIIVSALSALIAFFAQYMTKRVAIVAAALIIFTSVTAGFMAAAYALLSAISVTMPSDLEPGLALIVPSNAGACLGAVASAHVLRWVYAWQVKVIQYRLV